MRANYKIGQHSGESVKWLRKDINISTYVRTARAHTRRCIRARACLHELPRARAFAGVRVRVCLARHPCVGYIQIYTHGNTYKYGSCATHARGLCVGASPMHTNVPVCAGMTVRRCTCVCASAVPSPHSHGLTHTDGSVFIYNISHALPCTPIVVRAYRQGGHAPRTRPGVRHSCMRVRARVCAWARPRVRALPAACEHFPPPPSVAYSARRCSSQRRPSTRTSARGTPPPSRAYPSYALLSARRALRRTALGRSSTHARPLCAAVPPMFVHVRLCMRM
jgi:hypothetical protein